ncbi:hypothetical protein BC628DRAFT_219234 [Trametes gibbosa]|nr:hypothetical protein BC628DRAFT_219234 [Trametes gibbosa]
MTRHVSPPPRSLRTPTLRSLIPRLPCGDSSLAHEHLDTIYLPLSHPKTIISTPPLITPIHPYAPPVHPHSPTLPSARPRPHPHTTSAPDYRTTHTSHTYDTPALAPRLPLRTAPFSCIFFSALGL